MTASVLTSQIRRAQPPDAPRIIAVLDTVAQEDGMLLDPGGRTVAHERARLTQEGPSAPFATWVVNDPVTQAILGTSEAVQGDTSKTHRVVTVALALLPSLRRQGVGQQLMRAMEAWARERGAWKMSLVCLSHNRSAMTFYHEIGYAQEARLIGHYVIGQTPVDAVWWVKWLDDPYADRK